MEKRFVLIAAVLMLAVCNYAIAQTNGSASANMKVNGNTKTSASSKTEQELRRVTQELLDAQLRGDKSVLERYLAANYIETNGNGKVSTRAQELENAQVSPAGYHASLDFEDVQVQEYGNTAVMNYKAKYGSDRNGQRITNLYRVTNVYIKQDGKWQLIAQHQSSMPADKLIAKVDPAIYDAYIGQYELTSNHFLTLTREGDKLIGQTTTGKTKLDFLPENETTFFLKGTRDQIIFIKDEKGQVTHINHRLSDGQVVQEKKIK
jgi:hypothetical protein